MADTDENGLIDPVSVENRITPKTKIIIPVHYGGHPCNLEAIADLAKKHGLVIIEDACHALGAKYRDSVVGACAHSDMAAFSFHPVKHITTGEGGMITTNSEELYRRLVLLRSHGITKDPELLEMKDEGPWHQEMQHLGFNYRLTDIQSTLGATQLKKLDDFVGRRKELARRYDEAFAGIEGIESLMEADGVSHSYHLYVVKLDDAKTRRRLFEHLLEKGVSCQVHYLPIHLQPYYRGLGFEEGECQRAENFYQRIISLPIYYELSNEEQDRIIELIRSFFDQ
jgi:perosamine synthetase